MEQVGLTEAIGALRADLSSAIAAGVDESLRFEVGEVTIEFEVALERSRGGEGGLNIWVLTLGGQASRSQTTTHRLTVPLKPVASDGGTVLTGETQIPD